jgi:hypothetical protein
LQRRDSQHGIFQEPFFLRSAHRFFIASDSRFLPSGVIPLRLFSLDATGCGAVTLLFRVTQGEVDSSSAAIARSSRPLSCFNTSTILFVSKICSFDLTAWHCRQSLEDAQIGFSKQ